MKFIRTVSKMGTKLKNLRGKDLYAFWESRITEQLQTMSMTVHLSGCVT